MGDLKALVVIVCLSLPVFLLARAPACEFAVDPEDFRRRRNLWFLITLLAFACHNFWLFILGETLLLLFVSNRESNRLAMFFALMMVVPSFNETIPGFAGIQTIITINHIRLLSLLLLLPAWLMIRRRPGVLPFGRTWADKCLFGYLALQLVLQLSAASLTGVMRYTIYSFLDVFLPFYVASRGLKDLRDYRDTVMTAVFAMVLMAPVALFEYARHWLLYGGLSGAMNIAYKMGAYMTRGDNLRAVVTAEHSIVLGYLATFGLGLLLYARHFISSRLMRGLAMVLLLAMLVATGARGPWVGAAAVLAVILLTGPDKMNRTIKVLLISVPVVAAVSFTEFGMRLLSVLPFIGTAETGSLDYRQRLFDISVPVILQNPWFGAFDYLSNPAMQELLQGDGIIDVVNSYLGVALTFGFVGLTLFCGVFVFSSWGVWQSLRRSDPGSESSLLGRTLLATVAGIMVTIFSCSSIAAIPWIYWLLLGMCVGYTQLVPAAAAATREVAVQGRRGYA